MAYNFKEYMERPDRLTAGHRMCAGCGASIALRNVMKAVHPEDHAVICNATSCMEVSTFIYPYTAWQDSYIHTAFENAGATCSGVEAAYRAMSKKGKIGGTYKFIAVGGDGGTYDIGFQSLSGAMERNTDMVYVCYDNEAYMNTGIQRSSATPLYADTTTTPVGTVSNGKPQNRKDLAEVIAAHHVPYVAQTTFVQNFRDLHIKSEKALYTPGPLSSILWHRVLADGAIIHRISLICAKLLWIPVFGHYLNVMTVKNGLSITFQRKSCQLKIS